MSLSDQQGMADFLALSRKVKTTRGAEHFDKPVGADIGPSPVEQATGPAPTPTRLRSLQRLYLAAKEAGNDALEKEAKKQFRAAFQAFAAKNSMVEAFRAVNEAEAKTEKKK